MTDKLAMPWAWLPEDYRTHHHDWETACKVAQGESSSPEENGYWQHQIDTLKKIDAEYTAATAQYGSMLNPVINAVFECVSPSGVTNPASMSTITGTQSAKVKRVEREDDGSFTVTIDHWPQSAQKPPEVIDGLAYWPYCKECRTAYSFDPDMPFAYCNCGSTEWGHPRPYHWVPNPFEVWQIRTLLGVPDDHDLMTHVRSLVGQWHATGAAQPAPAGMVPTVCDGKEQEAFEAWAKSRKFNMEVHPLHWLFLNERTWCAREGWAAALRYVSDTLAATPPTLNEAFDQVGAAMLRQVHGEVAATAAQVAHADDIAVDKFAAAMKEKLAAARAKGRGGWDDPEDLEQYLSNLLRAHVEKGDPRDVANFCCFLWNRGEAICAAPAVAVDEKAVQRLAEWFCTNAMVQAGGKRGEIIPEMYLDHARDALTAALKGDAS